MKAKSLDVNRWQAGRPGFAYTPVMQLWLVMLRHAMRDAHDVRDGIPSDKALLARHWFASPAPDSRLDPSGYAMSFAFLCSLFERNEDAERVAILEEIDAGGDFDTDECWDRLEALLAADVETDEELFPSLRVVPVLDQQSLFAAN